MNLSIAHLLYANPSKDLNEKDYYPGGMVMPERNFSTINYRFGWNTQEKVDEISGVGNHNTAMFWEYDNRVNRRWNLDPKPVSWESQYAVNGNNPILFNDPNGDFKTKFGANLYAFFTGGTAFEDEGGEWGVEKKTVSFAADKSYKLNYSRSFSWRGRSVGKDLNFESAKEEWIVNYEQQQQIDQMERDGLWDKTLTPEEAQKNVLNIGGTVWLPNLIFRNATAAANVVKSEQVGISKVEELLKAGNALDEGGFTVVGRALQKHGNRAGSIFPKATGNPTSINSQGEVVLNGILTNPNATSVIRHHARFGNVLEYRIPGGQGARFSGDGKIFIGFLE